MLTWMLMHLHSLINKQNKNQPMSFKFVYIFYIICYGIRSNNQNDSKGQLYNIYLNLETLKVRRHILCLWFAKQCLKNEKMAEMLPQNPGYNSKVRYSETYQVKYNNNNKLKDSIIPYLQSFLNEDNRQIQSRN